MDPTRYPDLGLDVGTGKPQIQGPGHSTFSAPLGLPADPVVMNERFSTRAVILVLLTVFVAAMGVRLGVTHQFVGLQSPPDLAADPDQADFEQFTYSLATGQGYALEDGTASARRAPGFAFTMLPAYLLTDRSYLAIRTVNITLSALSCVLIAGLVLTRFGPRGALLAGLGLAFYPGHFYHAMHLLSEAVFHFWLALALVLTLMGMRLNRPGQSVGWAARLSLVAAGIAWGLATLTRPQMLLLAPVFLAGVAFWAMRRRAWSPLLRTAAVMGVAVLVMLPWSIRNQQVMGTASISTHAGHGLWGGNNEVVRDDPAWRGRWLKISEVRARTGQDLPEGEVAAAKAAMAHGWTFIRENPGTMPELILWKLGRSLTPVPETPNRAFQAAVAVSWPVMLVLAGVGLGVWARRFPGELWPLLAPVLANVLVVVIFFGLVRHRQSLMPIFGALAGVGADALLRSIAQARVRRRTEPVGRVGPVTDDQRSEVKAQRAA